MSKSDPKKTGPAKRPSGLLSSLFQKQEEGEHIDYIDEAGDLRGRQDGPLPGQLFEQDEPRDEPEPAEVLSRETEAAPQEPEAGPEAQPLNGAPTQAAEPADADVLDDVDYVEERTNRIETPGEGEAGGVDRIKTPTADITQVGTANSNLPGAPGGGLDEVYTTGFSDVANARLWRRTKEARRRAQDKQRSYRDVFTPTRPKRRSEEFLGRRAIIGQLIEAIEEECAHVVMCGATGLGKTSLANVLTSFAKNTGYLVVRITGTADLTFSHLIRTMLEELSQQIEETPSGDVLWERLGVDDINELLRDSALDLVSEFLGEESLNVNRVIRALDKLSDHQAIVIIDDYEQIRSKDLKTKLAQVMKALSDQGGWLSFLVLGRAETPSDLLEDNIESLPNAVGLHLDPFVLHEVEEVILEGARRINLPFDDDTIQAVARLSQGVPNVLQWLCFLAARRAARRQGGVVEMEDLANIVADAVTKIDPRLRNQYDEITRYDRGKDNADLLYLAVRAPCTPSGLFSATSMSMLAKQVLGRSWSEAELNTSLLPLCGKSKSSVLRKLETTEGTYYRFAHPTMRSVVMLKKIVRIPLLSDSRTREVEETYLPAPENYPAQHHDDAPQGFDPHGAGEISGGPKTGSTGTDD